MIRGLSSFGLIDYLRLHFLYRAADMFVLPSRQENLPNTDVQSDIVVDNVTGTLADPFNWLQCYPFIDGRFAEASNLISRYPEHLWNTLATLGPQQVWAVDARHQPSHSPPRIGRQI
jgi:hypothetical protein